MYSGEEKLPGNIRAAYAYFKLSLRHDGAKLLYSPSHPQGVETVKRLKGELNVTVPKNRSHSGARAAAGRMQWPPL